MGRGLKDWDMGRVYGTWDAHGKRGKRTTLDLLFGLSPLKNVFVSIYLHYVVYFNVLFLIFMFSNEAIQK